MRGWVNSQTGWILLEVNWVPFSDTSCSRHPYRKKRERITSLVPCQVKVDIVMTSSVHQLWWGVFNQGKDQQTPHSHGASGQARGCSGATAGEDFTAWQDMSLPASQCSDPGHSTKSSYMQLLLSEWFLGVPCVGMLERQIGVWQGWWLKFPTWGNLVIPLEFERLKVGQCLATHFGHNGVLCWVLWLSEWCSEYPPP